VRGRAVAALDRLQLQLSIDSRLTQLAMLDSTDASKLCSSLIG
jgi:hypothetical protein